MAYKTYDEQAAKTSVGGHPRSVAGGSGAPAEAASLGIYANTSSALPKEPEKPSRKTTSQARYERFSLKSVANRLLPTSRTSKCMRWRVPGRSVKLKKGTETNRAYYHGLQVCGSVWACPVCWAKITERRRVELQAAIATAEAMGMNVYLVTLTVPHGLGDDLAEIVAKMEKAARKLSSDRRGIKFRESIGLIGTIRAWEVTDGDNGYHPHFHFLYFLKPPYHVDPKTVEWGLSPLWQDACVKVGLPRPSDAHGCRVDDGKKAGEYVAKGNWGLDSEMTKGHTKTSKTKHGRSMSDLLRAVLADPTDKRSAARFITYAETFKGKQQLFWSKGLKKLLAITEKKDEDLAQEEIDEATVLMSDFTDNQWRQVLKTKSEAFLLDLAEKSPESLLTFLSQMLFNSHCEFDASDYAEMYATHYGKSPGRGSGGGEPRG